ncbi:MAG: Smr/MutS family protein [Myxococcales bacterium]|nr:Smr/MutS family protein [Myxococcales bacterium]
MTGLRLGAGGGGRAELPIDPRRVRPEATLDLHGCRAAQVGPRVTRFVHRSRERGLRVVAVVHGKGLHSEGGVGVLRDALLRALSDASVGAQVEGFVTAPNHAGGLGATLLILR